MMKKAQQSAMMNVLNVLVLMLMLSTSQLVMGQDDILADVILGAKSSEDALANGTAEAQNEGDFIKRNGLRLENGAGDAYFIVGTNSYYLLEHASESESWLKREIVNETYRAARDLNLNVIRTWAFYDGKFMTSPGNYSEQFFDALDYVVAVADAFDLKLVLTLTNFWDAYGGMQQYVMWANNATSVDGLSVNEFYTSEQIKDWYKNNFLALANRVNKYSGIQYKDDPTILAWELANEPRSPGDESGDILQNWIVEMSHFIKEKAPKQMVTTGSEGMFGSSTPQYMYLNGNSTWDHIEYLPMTCTGVDFLRNHDNTTAIDLPSYHLYPDHHAEELCHRGAPASDCALQWTKAQSETRLALAQDVLKKPLFLGEFGKMKHPLMIGTLDSQVVYRNRLYAAVYEMIEDAAAADGSFGGSTFWMLSSRNYKDYDNFTVYVNGNGPDLPNPWKPDAKEYPTARSFRHYEDEVECVKRQLAAHPEWIDHHWYRPGNSADRWDDTVDRIEKNATEEEAFEIREPQEWYLDMSTVNTIKNHAANLDQMQELGRHNWYG